MTRRRGASPRLSAAAETASLFRRSLDFTSGAGQLMLVQLRGARGCRGRGEPRLRTRCARFFLRTGARRAALSVAGSRSRGATGGLVVDHGLECRRRRRVRSQLCDRGKHHLHARGLAAAERAAERAFFRDLDPDSTDRRELAAREGGAAAALRASAGTGPCSSTPGFGRPVRSAAQRCAARGARRRSRSRRARRSSASSRRGISRSADSICSSTAGSGSRQRAGRAVPVVGSKRLPDGRRGIRSSESARLHYRPKIGDPELWIAALDLFFIRRASRSSAWSCSRRRRSACRR